MERRWRARQWRLGLARVLGGMAATAALPLGLLFAGFLVSLACVALFR